MDNPLGFADWYAGHRAALDTIETEVAAERFHQDTLHGGPEADDTRPTAYWSRLIIGYANKALQMDEDAFRRRMVQIAALAYAAVEAHDRGAFTQGRKPAQVRRNEGG